jgi:diadenosine tetraphosphate (Ap4A) HIT family hydrolase
MLDPCVFCEIVAGTSPASLVAENALALAVLTIGPIRPGHVLVIPKRHVVGLPDANSFEGLGLTEWWQQRLKQPPRNDLDATAERLRVT